MILRSNNPMFQSTYHHPANKKQGQSIVCLREIAASLLFPKSMPMTVPFGELIMGNLPVIYLPILIWMEKSTPTMILFGEGTMVNSQESAFKIGTLIAL
jgi:hypothetical protein